MCLPFRFRLFASAFAVALAGAPGAARGEREGFGFEQVKVLARTLAAQPYVEPELKLDPWWRDLSYADHRKIRPRRERSLWVDQGRLVALEFFHPGWVFPRTLEFSEVDGGEAVPVPWEPGRFDYRDLDVPGSVVPPDGYAGFRVLAAVNGDEALDELAVFLGGTYFRALAPGLTLGTSARAMALDPAQGSGEEIPAFTRWWVEKPRPGDREFRAWALMDSPSVAGAWQFRIQPGRATVMEVDADVTFRKEVEMPAFAPFSSMHWYSEYTARKPQDYRPEVHDSDGLLLHLGEQEAVWRPLDQSPVVRHSVFATEKLRGFGLAQRDRDFASYQDIDAGFERRPSVWVEPVGAWPAGSVNLIERPARDDSRDNVVCFWRPAVSPKASEPFALSYRIQWLSDLSVAGLSRVLSSRRTLATEAAAEGEAPQEEETYRIDFAPLANPGDDKAQPELQVDVDSGCVLVGKAIERNPYTGGWRAVFRLRFPAETTSSEISCQLLRGGRILTERWSALWKRDQAEAP